MNRLKDLREDNELLQKDIAKLISISQTGYSKYEVETNDIPTDVLIELAMFYNTSIDYILYLTDKREAYPRSIMRENKETKSKKEKQKA